MVFYEVFNSPEEAISAEKKIKGWTRQKKIDLIRLENPDFKDMVSDDKKTGTDLNLFLDID